MGIRNEIGKAIRDALLGVSAYSKSPSYAPKIDDPSVVKIREALGGNLSVIPTTQLRWYLRDLETAQHQADAGDMVMIARLAVAMKRDGIIQGLMNTLTSGVVALPKKFYGEYGVEELRARNGTRSVFDDMFPAAERKALAADGRYLGVGIAELVPVEGRDFPVMVRLEPEFLQYVWIENKWYYRSSAGRIEIEPGLGRWILHVPGGRIAPWREGCWPALGRAFINKEHAMLHRSNYSAKLANPARVAEAPAGATENMRKAWLRKVMAWGINTVFETPPGYAVKLLESNGRGYEVFKDEITTSDLENMITLIGTTVMVDGGAGFQNADLFRAIKLDIIKTMAEGLDYTLNTQGIPPFVAQRYGVDAIEQGACVETDISRPRDLVAEAQSLTQAAAAIDALDQTLQRHGRSLNIDEVITRFGIPIEDDRDGDGAPDNGETEVDEEAMAIAATRSRTRAHLRVVQQTWRRHAA